MVEGQTAIEAQGQVHNDDISGHNDYENDNSVDYE